MGILGMLPKNIWAIALCLAAAGAAQAQAQANARVQPGDRLLFRIWLEEQGRLSDTLNVDPRGFAVFPRIGAVRVADYAVEDARDSVAAKLAKFYNTPIDLVVLRRITVGGAVKTPNVFYVDHSATVRDVIARAGGMAEDGDPRRVDLVRAGESMRLNGWDTPAGESMALRSGDQINVGRRNWVVMNAVQLGGLGLAILSLAITLKR